MAQEFTFGIKGIELLDYSITSPSKQIEQETSFRFDINIEHRFNIEAKTIFVIVTLRILDQDTEVQVGNARISCIYQVVNIDSYVVNEKITFPDEIIIALNSISLSTCRGVLFTLFRGTFLHNAILPVVDPNSFKALQ